MTVILTRVLRFCASHRYYNPSWTDEENARVFGKCARPHGHGHNYVCEISVAGEVNGETGMVVDLKQLSTLLEAVVMERYDHRNLNLDVPEFATRIPTTENLATDIWRCVAARLEAARHAGDIAPVRLHSVRLHENPQLFVEYYGEGSLPIP